MYILYNVKKCFLWEKQIPFHMLVIVLTPILTEISAYKRSIQKTSDFPSFFGNENFSKWPQVAGTCSEGQKFFSELGYPIRSHT